MVKPQKGWLKALGVSVAQAKLYQEREARLYPRYQEWLAINAENRAFDGFVETECGWKLWMPKRPTAHDIRTAMNLPMQGNCAEIMRLTWVTMDRYVQAVTPAKRHLINLDETVQFFLR